MQKIVEDINEMDLSADGSKLLYDKGREWFLINSETAPKAGRRKIEFAKDGSARQSGGRMAADVSRINADYARLVLRPELSRAKSRRARTRIRRLFADDYADAAI
ncbi:MAG: hypothetical protein WKF71_11930 [Pyrinomonadaceae bacterium]